MNRTRSYVSRVFAGGRGFVLPLFWVPLRRWVWPPAGDGCGADDHGPRTVHNLRWFRLSGVFAQASESVVLAYLTLFVLALGANRAQIGLMSALASLSAALFLLPGATLVERWGHRKAICVLGGGGGARVVLLLLALVPLGLAGPTAVYVAIALIVLRSALANVALPAWTSLTADIVPVSCRGRYFASRNIAMAVAGVVTTYFVGLLITRVGSPRGYQLALGIAFTIGIVSTFGFARLHEASMPTESVIGRKAQLPLLRRMRKHPDFLAFCAAAALWNGALGVASPFFSVYMVENLGANASIVGTLSVVSTLAALPGQRLFGTLADRWGPRRIQLLTGLIIPLIPWGWALARSPWHLAPIELLAGFLWAGYGLANFNLLLLLTPEKRRSRYTALYQISVTIALAAGSALGGVLATAWGIRSVFVLSGIGRLGAALMFARFVRPPRDESQPDYGVPGSQTFQKRHRFGYAIRRT